MTSLKDTFVHDDTLIDKNGDVIDPTNDSNEAISDLVDCVHEGFEDLKKTLQEVESYGGPFKSVAKAWDFDDFLKMFVMTATVDEVKNSVAHFKDELCRPNSGASQGEQWTARTHSRHTLQKLLANRFKYMLKHGYGASTAHLPYEWILHEYDHMYNENPASVMAHINTLSTSQIDEFIEIIKTYYRTLYHAQYEYLQEGDGYLHVGADDKEFLKSLKKYDADLEAEGFVVDADFVVHLIESVKWMEDHEEMYHKSGHEEHEYFHHGADWYSANEENAAHPHKDNFSQLVADDGYDEQNHEYYGHGAPDVINLTNFDWLSH